MSDDYNRIAAVEKAIKEKYGEEAIANPKADWDETKEKKYLQQMKELYNKNNKKRSYTEKVDVDGIKMSKKLLNRESLIKFECCRKCFIKFVEGREERWLQGWRPNENQQTKT